MGTAPKRPPGISADRKRGQTKTDGGFVSLLHSVYGGAVTLWIISGETAETKTTCEKNAPARSAIVVFLYYVLD